MVTYVCAELVNSVCQTWVESQSFLPDLTNSDRDSLLLWMISCFVIVFTVKKIIRLFN